MNTVPNLHLITPPAGHEATRAAIAAAVDAVADRIAAAPALSARRPPVEEEEQMLIAPAPPATRPSRQRTGDRPS